MCGRVRSKLNLLSSQYFLRALRWQGKCNAKPDLRHLYVFPHESGNESSFFRPADGRRSRSGRGSHADSCPVGGDAENFSED
jgi:hypothetical protein